MVSRKQVVMTKLRSMRACRLACKEEDSGTELFLLNTVNSFAAGFRHIPGHQCAGPDCPQV
jgi:hypothetical protein